jgi:alkanesulfonate monooxygenase SsuD/methylene tetrahydromethanopterin reductase-like flavin-dependent oxidoreductase (luciferase family)
VDEAPDEIADIRRREASAGRKRPLGVIGTIVITCRESRKEAEEFNRYYAIDNADRIAVDAFIKERSANATSSVMTEERFRMGAGGGGTVVGTPEDVVDVLVKLHKAGFDGATITTLNFLDDLPIIIDRVLPLMEQAGLRKPRQRAADTPLGDPRLVEQS